MEGATKGLGILEKWAGELYEWLAAFLADYPSAEAKHAGK